MADTETPEPLLGEIEFDYDTKKGRALAKHEISKIDVEIMHLQELKARHRAKLAGKE